MNHRHPTGSSWCEEVTAATGAKAPPTGRLPFGVTITCRQQGVLGFRLMQFTLLVSSNTAAVRCWQRNGFQVVMVPLRLSPGDDLRLSLHSFSSVSGLEACRETLQGPQDQALSMSAMQGSHQKTPGLAGG